MPANTLESMGMELLVKVAGDNETRLQVGPSWFLVGLCRMVDVTCQSADKADTTLTGLYVLLVDIQLLLDTHSLLFFFNICLSGA